MSQLAITKELNSGIDEAIEKVTNAIREVGFGVLTRIDFDQKIKEKLNENIPKSVILGACNPRLAYEAYQQNTDTLLLIPCNIVVRETGPNKCLVEAIRPTEMLKILSGMSQVEHVLKAEADLTKALHSLT